MQEDKYYIEIDNLIKRNEINKRRRILEENYDLVNTYWHMGKLLVEAQGGESRAKYGNELIKKWSTLFTNKYGKGYNRANLFKFRQFYLAFPIISPLGRQLTWSHIRELLPIKDINKRNYYINLCIEKNLSKRKLIEEIKSNSYERLINKPEHIDLIIPKKEYKITNDMKNPIIIKVANNKKIQNEKDLELTILSEIEFILTQLGKGFTFVGDNVNIFL